MIQILVSAHIEGDLAYFPRLHTALQALHKGFDGQSYLVDTGAACASQAWICEATEHRAPYIILDAMGYDLAFADDLSGENLQKLAQQTSLQILSAGQKGALAGFGIEQGEPALKADALYLPQPERYTIFQMTLEGQSLRSMTFLPFPETTLPDPTIAGTVDFVVSEARYYQRKSGD